jgi:hypothetical protein
MPRQKSMGCVCGRRSKQLLMGAINCAPTVKSDQQILSAMPILLCAILPEKNFLKFLFLFGILLGVELIHGNELNFVGVG